ncbi:MAG: PAS domain S-box protein [Spirochaetaceae bacterium]|jgi:PAS domain S-box-containing protein|nr:PAS domain S-box protein [Spirochaetaceae bacterium]
MREFVQRVVQKLPKMTNEQVRPLFEVLTGEYEKLDSIIESLSTGLLICDVKWNLLQANKAAERYIRLKPRGNSAQPVWSMVEDDDISAFLHSCWKRQKSVNSQEFSIDFSGSVRFITVSTVPLVQKRRVTGTIIRIDDITEKRNHEVLLRRMENLASLTSLAASVAHEIKNPLGSISIHIQLVQKAVRASREGDGLLPDESRVEKYLAIVNEEIERLNKIIVDFLFAVRPINATLLPVNPTQMLVSLADFFRPELESCNIDLQLNLLEHSPELMLDERLCKQMIINLVKNSIVSMPSGGMLWISTLIKDERYIIKVADTGEGMPEEALERIFEPYYTTKANGTGLGLTMVYKIVQEHSGTVEVQSVPDEGTVFTITFPIPQKEKKLLGFTDEDRASEEVR